MAGYVERAARPHVLADLILAGGAASGHEPMSYDVFVAAAPGERWASVTCACGAEGRADWADADADYRVVLRRAWATRSCSASTHA